MAVTRATRIRARRRGWCALGLAVAAHAAGLAIGLAQRPTRAVLATSPAELDVLVDDGPSTLPPPSVPAQDDSVAPDRAAARVAPAQRRLDRSAAKVAEPPSEAPSASRASTPEATGDAPWAPSWTIPGALNVGLDAGSTWSVAMQSQRPGAGGADEEHGASTREVPADPGMLRAALDEAESERGYGRGGAVVSAVEETGSVRDVSDGVATLEVSTDEQGRVASVRVLDATSDDAGWGEAARAVREALASHTLRVPRGARGLVVAVRIEVARRLPSGARGIGVAPMSRGVGGTFDLSDLGAHARPVVHARIVSEKRL